MGIKPAEQKPARGRGRPTLEEGALTVVVPIRMTAVQREKLNQLAGEMGGAQWVRQQIDKARIPK